MSGAITRDIHATDRYEKLLSAGAIVLGVAMAAAIVRGHAHWAEVPRPVWLHLLTIAVAVALTPTMLLSPRGTPRHRRLGRIWCAAMVLTALLSFGVHTGNPGGYGPIHLLSAATLVLAPLIWWTARTHQVARHRRAVRGMVTGALLIAGFFTFPFDRLLGHWLFG